MTTIPKDKLEQIKKDNPELYQSIKEKSINKPIQK